MIEGLFLASYTDEGNRSSLPISHELNLDNHKMKRIMNGFENSEVSQTVNSRFA
jgi:hypothetical protein